MNAGMITAPARNQGLIAGRLTADGESDTVLMMRSRGTDFQSARRLGRIRRKPVLQEGARAWTPVGLAAEARVAARTFRPPAPSAVPCRTRKAWQTTRRTRSPC